MKTKTAYRPKVEPAGISAPSVPVDDPERIQPSETTRIDFATDKGEPAIGIVSADEYPQPDEATLALQKQISDLKKSEELQRNYARYAAQQQSAGPALPAGRAERIALWRQHGLSDDDAAFLEARPSMIDHPQITRQAVAAAEQSGLERGSDDFNNAVENNFNTLMGRDRRQPIPPGSSSPDRRRHPHQRAPQPSTACRYLARSPAIASPRRGRSSSRRPSSRSRQHLESQTSNMQKTNCGCSESVPQGNGINASAGPVQSRRSLRRGLVAFSSTARCRGVVGAATNER
jgi:hypothetical protein